VRPKAALARADARGVRQRPDVRGRRARRVGGKSRVFGRGTSVVPRRRRPLNDNSIEPTQRMVTAARWQYSARATCTVWGVCATVAAIE